MKKRVLPILLLAIAVTAFVIPVIAQNIDKATPPNPGDYMTMKMVTPADRAAAAQRARMLNITTTAQAAAIGPGGVPDYFGTTPNWNLSPMAQVNCDVTITDATGVGAAAVASVGGVSSITLVSGGTGYSAKPKVTITGGGGYGAKATAIAVGGVILAITLDASGQLYTSNPTVVITDATGTGASATAVASPGAVTQITLTSGGLNYSATPTITITGSGAGAAATATVTVGSITAITVTAPGTGYGLATDATGKVTGIRKFVDTLPGLGPLAANNLGQYIQVAVPDVTTYPGSDYYEIGLVQYTEKLHSDLAPTTLRGYVQLNDPASPATKDATGKIIGWPQPHYLGPMIVASMNKPVRVKFTNLLPTGAGGNLFIPTDTTAMGAGMGPNGGMEMYTQNRGTIHLHGGASPWISDGTPHQWITPVGEVTSYPKGVSVVNVPDMPDPGPGSMTFFYTNQQSARLMFYHDHAYGLTRLNVYAGEAAGYLVTDPVEQTLISGGTVAGPAGNSVVAAAGTIPADQIPLIIQDKGFVDPATIKMTDPTWNWGSTPGTPTLGDLWFPHVYMPNQNPYDLMGVNAMGRWDYGPWFWPPYTGMLHQPVANPLFGTTPIENPQNPATPNPSMVPEAFMDTMMVNGTVYPVLTVQPKAYRLRILNACNDRFLNLSLFYAASNGVMWDPATGALLDPAAGEVTMVSATPNAGLPTLWPTDGRDGGVPDPAAAGPSWIVIGNEGGLLPQVAIIPPTPVGYDYNRRSITVLNVLNHSLYLGPAERADVIVDFSQCPPGSNLVLYNDAPAPVPAFDPRNDYYTGAPDQTPQGGAPPTVAGYGPNTRTVMKIQVAGTPAPAFNVAALQAALPVAFAATQDAPIIPQATYNAAFNTTAFPVDGYVRIQDTTKTFTPYLQAAPITMPLQPKCIQELFETNYGRMNATFGVELPFTTMTTQTTIPYNYMDPATEILKTSMPGSMIGMLGDGTQIWKITHNGVDTHTVHFHMYNVQLINRVGWDGQVKPPSAEEYGWKETVKANPLEDIIFAMRPVAFNLPFSLPNSVRAIDPTQPIGGTMTFTNIDPNNRPVTVTNQIVNYGWEYVWHCHLLGHEENDMMRAVIVADPPIVPANVTVALINGKTQIGWTDASTNETRFGIQRATVLTGPWSNLAIVASKTSPTTGTLYSYTDGTAKKQTAYYYRVVATDVVGGVAPGYPSLAVDSTPSVVTSNVPNGPLNVMATAVAGTTSDQVTLTWTAGSTIQQGYRIQVATDIAFTQNLNNYQAGSTALTYLIKGLLKATNYYIRIQAYNQSGSSAWVMASPSPILTP